MPKIEFSLEEQNTDKRSNEITYKFTVNNHSSTPIKLLRLITRIPENVKLIEATQPSSTALKSQHNDLCKEISVAVDDFLFVYVKKFRDKNAQVTEQAIKGMMSLSHLMRLYFLWMYSFRRRRRDSVIENLDKHFKTYSPRIENALDADNVYQAWLKDHEEAEQYLASLIRLKIAQLKLLETGMSVDSNASILATVESDSSFSITYVLKFDREYLEQRNYNLSIEGIYYEQGSSQELSGAASTSLVISPNPLSVTLVAMAASILGVSLKTGMAVASSTAKLSSLPTSLADITKIIHSSDTSRFIIQVLCGLIIALVFFNIYEHTEIGKKVNMNVSWRSALLIGMLSGLLEDKILKAIMAIIGT